ncbi:hypothetical protein AA103196_1146 [Ameyamaea chiangmaiensis NBRC 103196]|uniref:DUF2474 domain-containing protein n=1 Tax=Ameyamaea chiangmaiensis TaxID=442969 RepID=A0A850PF65_9PROT|nr:DUF2474 domain-containing protein [Ameyamaea chiangmaiensis]MBS4075085.1 DUF2474 domain-containing protein [Ameyamaea chiangmaiensis]NVN40552.1 DUF2474 domain-containing protein [Ameyamaea chiangmaiensis]GBQ65521.1 hypothetical protein AA103196_1146 [Ameyamaea chiangmaiensis NBRC 103196]
MPIIEFVSGQGEGAPKSRLRRLGWFALIWALSTAAFIAFATVLRLFVPH